MFDRAAGDYDRTRRRVIPCFDEFYLALLRPLEFSPGEEIRVLDLGTGTGLVASLVRAAFPRAQVVGLDLSAEMLARARERFAGDSRVRLEVRDYRQGELGRGLDAVVSAMSIHHLSHAEKRGLFARVYAALKPGGVFVNADLVLGSSPRVEEGFQRRWREHVEAAGLSEGERSEIYRRMACDRPAALREQLAWLEETGLSEVECYYKNDNFAVLAGRRPGGEV